MRDCLQTKNTWRSKCFLIWRWRATFLSQYPRGPCAARLTLLGVGRSAGTWCEIMFAVVLYSHLSGFLGTGQRYRFTGLSYFFTLESIVGLAMAM